MIFAASWAISARLYALVQRFAPSNIVIRRVHTRSGVKWGPLVGLAGVIVYELVMAATATVVRAGVMSDKEWSPRDLPAASYIRVAPTTTHEAERQVEQQRAQIARAADRLGLRMADEFMDVGSSGMSMDRPGLRRLLDHVAAQQVGYCVVATSDRLSEDPVDAADIDEALSDALVVIVVAADHIGPALPRAGPSRGERRSDLI